MKNRFVLISTAVIVFLLGTIMAYRYYDLLTRNVVEALISGKRMINIFVAGSNTYNNNRHRFCGIFSFNPENGKIGFTFLPPELVIDSEANGTASRKLKDMDISDFGDLRELLSRELKMNVPFYLELYAVDMERIIDLIGGIDIFLLDQWRGETGFTFGLNYLDGKKAVRYINASSSIFKKYDRVQDVVLSLNGNKDSYKHLLTPGLITEMMKSFKTNLMPQEMISLGRILMDNADIACTILPGEYDDSGNYIMDNISYKIYEKEFLAPLLTDDENTGAIKVKILNGTEIPGLARKMRNLLIREGLNVVEFGTSPYPRLDHSILVNQRGNIANTRKVMGITGIKNIYHVIDTSQLHDVLIILGKESIKGESKPEL